MLNELLLGTVNDSYRASLVGARVTYDITNRWSVGGITTMLAGSGGAKQYAYGLEVGYTLWITYWSLWATTGVVSGITT